LRCYSYNKITKGLDMMKWIVGILLIFLMVGIASGTVTQYNITDGTYNTTVFNGTGSTSWTIPTGVNSFEYLIVAGGAGGENGTSKEGGGGGGGQVVTGTYTGTIEGLSTTITVGDGGAAGAVGGGDGVNGTNSTLDITGVTTLTAIKGEGGGVDGDTEGGDSATYSGGAGSGGFGYGAGGGAGSGANGANGVAPNSGGAGGDGVASSIIGTLTFYGGGGGGGGTNNAAGGAGGGGAGNNYAVSPATAGTDDLGGGGGGGWSSWGAKKGGSGTIIIKYLIPVFTPITDFSANNTTGNAGMVVQFTDLSTSFSGITAWNWSFGDGNFSNSQNPSYTYAYSGQYTVILISQSHSLSNTSTKIGYINVGIATGSVTASFIASPTSGNYPLTVAFQDLSICNPVCNAWAWDFNNDGSIDSTAKNPTYTYTTPGAYSPHLIASNNGNSNVIIRPKYINVGPAFVPPTIAPQPTPWVPTYQRNNISVSFILPDQPTDLQNSTYLKDWLQNFTATGNFSVYGFATSLMAPMLHVFGFWIYLIIWGLYLFAVWIRSQDVTLPLIVGILSIGTFGLLFPKESLPVIIIMFVVCGAIILTKLLKDSI
jgi:PKD repeat protein